MTYRYTKPYTLKWISPDKAGEIVIDYFDDFETAKDALLWFSYHELDMSCAKSLLASINAILSEFYQFKKGDNK